MSLSMLTTSGWLWFAFALCATLAFIARLAGNRRDRIDALEYALPLGLILAWLVWLVTP